MITFARELYLNNISEDQANEIKKKLLNKENVYLKYLVCISFSETEAFEIIPSINFMQDVYIDTDFKVIGIANNKRNAIKLVAKLMDIYYSSKSMSNGISAREYYINELF